MITTRDPKRALEALRDGKRVTLDVPRNMVAAYEEQLASLPAWALARLKVRGSEAAERKGCIALRTTRKGIQVGLYYSDESDLDGDEDVAYTTVCETHGTLVSHETRKAAEESLSHPDWWCDDCRGYPNTMEGIEHKKNVRTERVIVQETFAGTNTPMPEHLRVYGTRKVVHGLTVVEVTSEFYLSPDLRVSATRQPGGGWVIADDRRGDYGDTRTKPEALRGMIEWAERLAREDP